MMHKLLRLLAYVFFTFAALMFSGLAFGGFFIVWATLVENTHVWIALPFLMLGAISLLEIRESISYMTEIWKNGL